MAYTGVAETAKRIRRELMAGYRHQQVQISAALDASEVSVTITGSPSNNFGPGAVLSVDLELMLITAVSTNTATVIRGYLDSTAATHVINSLADVNPRFSLLAIVDAMRSEINSWGHRLFYPLSDTLAVATSAMTYQLPVAWVGLISILELRQSAESGDYTAWPRISAKLVRGPAADFDGASTSGLLLRFTEGIRTGEIFVIVAMPYSVTTIALTEDLITDHELTVGLIELVELGVKRRLMTDELAGKASRQAQGETRVGEETQVGTLVPIGQLQLAQYTARLNAEIANLRARYPYWMG